MRDARSLFPIKGTTCALVLFAQCLLWNGSSRKIGPSAQPRAATLGQVQESHPEFLTLPKGERLVLRLRTERQSTDIDEFEITHPVLLDPEARLLLPSRTMITGRITTFRPKAGPFWGPGLSIQFQELVLRDGTSIPFQATILRTLQRPSQGKRLSGASSALAVEVSLDESLLIPRTSSVLDVWSPPSASTPEPGTAPSATESRPGTPFSPPGTDSLLPSLPERPEAVRLTAVVDRILVEAVVRDRKGRLMEGLGREDFRLYEEGSPVDITEFSKARRPIALAIVVDSSGSITPFQGELKKAALTTLNKAGPDDLVALLTFSNHVTRIVDLTNDHQRIVDRLGELVPQGRTNIHDAIAQAATYLGSAAPAHQHAVILISDNQATRLGELGEGGSTRLALYTGTIVYSLKLPGAEVPHSVMTASLGWIGDPQLVERLTEATGGEIVEIIDGKPPLAQALESILTALKQRYCLAFTPSSRAGASFRKIEVRLAERFGIPGKDYRVAARRGYYPKVEVQSPKFEFGSSKSGSPNSEAGSSEDRSSTSEVRSPK